MTIRTPLLTLAAVSAAAVSIWLVNGSHEPGATVPSSPAAPAAQVNPAAPTAPATPTAPAASAPVAAVAPAAPSEPPPTPQPARYVAEIPTRTATLGLDITVEGDRARAYACDSAGIEVWLRGRAVDGFVNLSNTDGSSRLDGAVTPAAVTGTLSISGKQWNFTARPVGGSDA